MRCQANIFLILPDLLVNTEMLFKFQKNIVNDKQENFFAPIKFTWRYVFLCASMAAYVAMAGLSGMHLDLARDARVAFDIIDGQSYPLLGPILAGQVRLGAGWYYLLAALYALGGSWLGAMVSLYLIGSLQFPLAYLAGKAWRDRTTGLIWSALLLLPSWSFFELVFPTHTLLTAPLTIATILFILRFWRGGHDEKYFYASVLFFSLDLHAHPTAIVLIFPIFVTFLYLLIGLKNRLQFIVLSLTCGLLPFLTLLIYQIKNSFNIESMVNNYINQQSWVLDWQRLLELLWQIAGGGFHYWVASVSGWPIAIATFLSLIFVLTMLLGVVGFIYLKLWKLSVNAWILFFMAVAVIVTFLIRGNYPYYMLTVLHVVFLGFVAVGLAGLFYKNKLPVFILMATCLISFMGVIFQVFMLQKNGNWNISIFPLYDVVAKNYDPHSLVIMPAYAVSDGSRWLCSQDSLAVHGALAVHLLQDYALEYRLECPANTLVLGSTDPAKNHWIGLSHDMLQNIAVKSAQDLGPLRLLRARPLSSHKITNVMELNYPPVAVNNNSSKIVNLVLEIKPGEHLAITNFGTFFMQFPDVKIEVSGRVLEPVAKDWMTKVYYCESCNSRFWKVEFKTSQPELVNIVAF